jgi:hypothetical protein
VRWATGGKETLGSLAAGQEYHVREGAGVVERLPLREEGR